MGRAGGEQEEQDIEVDITGNELAADEEDRKIPVEDDDEPSPEEDFGTGLEDMDETGRNIVKTVKLDDLFQDEADIIFMKVDTEGHEFEVLKSAERLLKVCTTPFGFPVVPDV